MRGTAKVLRFPLAGIARDIDYRKAYIPAEESVFATPFAVNVRGDDTFYRRMRGGSRPGLSTVTLATGARVENQHEQFATTGLGITPVSATTFYRARNCAASGNAWYMSAMGAPANWTFNGDANDPSRAFAGTIEVAARPGDTITALIPIRDQWLFIATKHSIWCLTGDPVGGQLRCVSGHVGCVSRDAWCFDGSSVWVLSNQGLYAIPVGEMPVKVSSRLPEDFNGIAGALLVYDYEDNAIHIFATDGEGNASDWFYDIGSKAFWKQKFKSAHRPTEAGVTMLDGVAVTIFKGGDGAWREFDNSSDTDDGETFESVVAIGPIRCGDRDDIDGIVAELNATIADGSDDVTVSVYTANSPEKAVHDAENDEGTPYTASVSEGWNDVLRPRKRGAWAVFVLSSTGRWGYESMTAVFKALGRLRP